MKTRVFLIALLALTISCQKIDVSPTAKPADLVSFKFDIAAFTIQDATFKSLDKDSVFSEFKHVYPELNQVWFTAKDGTTYNPDLVEHYKSLDTRTFTLPIGDYTVTGGSEIPPFVIEPVMLYKIDAQAITITKDTKVVPVTLTPTSWLVIIADPYLQVDTTNWPNSKSIEQLLDYNWNNRGEFMTTALVPYNWNPSYPKSGDFRLTYAYCSMLNDPDLYVSFEKRHSDQVQIPTKDFKAGHVYRIFIDKSKTLDITPGFQSDSIKSY